MYATRGLHYSDVPTAQQIADFFTKQLGPGPNVAYRVRFMSVLPTPIAELLGFVCSIVSSRDPLWGC
jgi:hypothetical protein